VPASRGMVAYRVVTACALFVAAAFSASVAQSVRDSAGTRIVENAQPLLNGARAPRLASAPLLELDPTKGADYTFGGVIGALRLADGRVFVAARTAPQFRLFDRNGRLLHGIDERTADRSSDVGHSLAKLRGDTIAILYSREATRLVVVGDSLRQISTPREAPREAPRETARGPARELLVNVLTNGGRASMNIPQPSNRAVGTQWADSTGLVLRDRDGALIRALGNMPYMTFEMTKTGPTPPWLSAIAISCSGAGRFHYGFGNEFSLRVYSETGALESIVRRAWTPTPVTPADWEHWVTDWSKLWVKERGADSIKAVQSVREEPYAFELPAFAGCLVAQDGNLWVREAHLDDAISAGSLTDDPLVASKWSVFSPAGRWISDVTMPAGFQPTDIGTDYVAGRFRKGPGRTTVVVYRLSPDAR
jgi:hypothetical protein